MVGGGCRAHSVGRFPVYKKQGASYRGESECRWGVPHPGVIVGRMTPHRDQRPSGPTHLHWDWVDSVRAIVAVCIDTGSDKIDSSHSETYPPEA